MKTTRKLTLLLLSGALLTLHSACGDVDEPNTQQDEQEIITTLKVTFTPMGGGAAVIAQLKDADGEGGAAPVITNPTLAAATTYTVTLEVLNETVPSTDEEFDITKEIKEEAQEHQFYFTGDALGGLLTHAYADKESDYTENTGSDLPVGLKSTITTSAAGAGKLIITLKHQPPVNDKEVKTDSSTINDGGTDIEATFEVTVQ